ncbi:Predicted amidohydrolase YtcJ [Acetitomaculum ruminis DSM 5522]|uniref:Predicted amidohydrolase YtcJ n=1 Tax=Acetitomaculum ruminis DSM 5522 TaxID=1120918 RepID=A0A1I0Z0J5_9FIRM|nr:amidohydrolase family protein [Acetitomaculum ruminis]SFB19219.1 Predicted amidohydrolase YtcJ [Acetitomaculum ruminis DSM 5522]
MKKKRVLAVLLAIGMACSLCACTGGEKDSDTKSENTKKETKQTSENTDDSKNDATINSDSTVIYTNAGNILTEDDETQGATVFAVKDGKFVYVGNDVEEVEKDDNTVTVDLEGKYVTPNLIDAHTHPGTVAMTKWCTEIDGETKEELLTQIEEALSEKDIEEEPYVFFKSFPSDLFGEEGPKKEWLDDICKKLDKDFAIAVSDFNDHSVWVNSKWLEIYTMDENATTEGFNTNADGSYTGYISELHWMDYMDSFYENLGWKPPIDATEELMSIVTDDLKQWGMTGVFDAYIESDEQVESVSQLDKDGKLNMYYDLSVKLPQFKDLEDVIARIKRLNDNYSTDHVKVDTIKIFYDGTNEAGTSALVDGLATDPNNHGYLLMNEDETYQVLKRANEEKLDVQFHMVGDLAFRQACDATQRLENEIGQLDSQVEFCHCEYINPADRERPAKLGIIINWTPQWSGGYFGEAARTYLGDERYNDMYQFNPTIEAGGIVTFGSDIYSWDEEQRANPYFGMQTAMTRVDIEYPLEDENGNPKARESESAKLSLENLLKGYTINAAIALRVDDVTGSITKGKSANFNIYEKDLFDVDVEELKDVLPEKVYFEGNIIAEN